MRPSGELRLPAACCPERRRAAALLRILAQCQLKALVSPNRALACSYYLDSRQAAAQHEEAEEAAAPAKAPARRVDAAELLREAEEAAGDAGMELLDSRGLKRLTLALERKVGAGGGPLGGAWLQPR